MASDRRNSNLKSITDMFKYPGIKRNITNEDAAYILRIKSDNVSIASIYASELGLMCSETPEWNWTVPLGNEPGSEQLYVIRGFMNKNDCTAELNSTNQVGDFIIRFSDNMAKFAIGFVTFNNIITYAIIEYANGGFSLDNSIWYTSLSEFILNHSDLFKNLLLKSSNGMIYRMPYNEIVMAKRGRQGGRRKYCMKRNNHVKKRTHRNKKRGYRKTKSRRSKCKSRSRH